MSPEKRNKGKSLQAKSAKISKWEVSDLIKGQLNVSYCSVEFQEMAQKAWHDSSEKDQIQLTEGATIHKKPFSCCFLPNFVQNVEFLEQLKEELLCLSFNDKSNDLYKFQQSEDLRSVRGPYVTALRKFLYFDFRNWLTNVTGVELNDTVDMSCAQYNCTDVLLCHDDELDGRRFAYILYFVDEHWTEEDGGTLDLFACDDNGQPTEIVKSLVPQWNSFAFFEVTPYSFHQVSEVLTENKCRLSISGWFHGKPVKRPSPFLESIQGLCKPVDLEEEEFYGWINPIYLDPVTQGDIQEAFVENSEIQLQDFLNAEKYLALCEAISSPSLTYVQQGPPNKRHYSCVAEDAAPVLKEAVNFFKSEAFFLILSNLTGLKLHHLAPSPSSSDNESDENSSSRAKEKRRSKPRTIDPYCRIQVTRWNAGSYTMLHDEDADVHTYALDTWLFLLADNWQITHGGQITYVARGEDEELLTVCPASNCLALVFRDDDTLRFVKHINSSSGDLKHFSISGVYFDRPPKNAQIT